MATSNHEGDLYYDDSGMPDEPTETERWRARDYILERIVVDKLSGCWVWQKARSQGYGRMRWGSEFWSVHRFSYHYLVAYLHKASVVHHTCSNRACCNPAHLAAVSHHDNVAEMRGRAFYEEELAHLRDEIDRLNAELTEERES